MAGNPRFGLLLQPALNHGIRFHAGDGIAVFTLEIQVAKVDFIHGRRRLFIWLRVFWQRPAGFRRRRTFNAGFFLRFISRNRNAFRFCFDRVFIRQTAGQSKLVKHG